MLKRGATFKQPEPLDALTPQPEVSFMKENMIIKWNVQSLTKKKQSTIHIKDFKFDFDVPDYGLTSLLTLLNDYRDCFTMSIHELYGAPISTYINIH